MQIYGYLGFSAVSVQWAPHPHPHGCWHEVGQRRGCCCRQQRHCLCNSLRLTCRREAERVESQSGDQAEGVELVMGVGTPPSRAQIHTVQRHLETPPPQRESVLAEALMKMTQLRSEHHPLQGAGLGGGRRSCEEARLVGGWVGKGGRKRCIWPKPRGLLKHASTLTRRNWRSAFLCEDFRTLVVRCEWRNSLD